MPWDKHQQKSFPARHPREPTGLRQDILDEIADHLACAAEVEGEGQDEGNEDSAWRRALERFGDPDAVARRLWWDAMRETVMREWIQTGVLAMLAVAAIAGVVFMGLMLRQFGATNHAVLTALSQQQAGEARWTTLELEFRRGSEDGPPAEGIQVVLSGKMFDDGSANDAHQVGESGMASFGPMQPGRFMLQFNDPYSGLFLERSMVLYASASPTHTVVVVPDVKPNDVEIQFPAPVSPGADKQLLVVRLESEWKHGDDVWRGVQECFFGPDSGKAFQELPMSPESYSATAPPEQRPSVNSDYVPLAKYPVRIAGAPAKSHMALLIRNTGDRWFADERYSLSLEPVGDTSGSTYRAALEDELRDELRDWALYDQMTAQGLSVSKDLAAGIRRQFPDQHVGATIPVTASSILRIAGQDFFASEGKERVYETLQVANSDRLLMDVAKERKTLTQAWNAVLQLPDDSGTYVQSGSRLILAIYIEYLSRAEFNNPLEAWAVQNDVFALEWPLWDEGVKVMVEGTPNLHLGDAPLDTIPVDSLNREGWYFLEVTSAVANGGATAHAALLRWKHSGEDYDNVVRMVSAEAKNIENQHRHPLWLVLDSEATK